MEWRALFFKRITRDTISLIETRTATTATADGGRDIKESAARFWQ